MPTYEFECGACECVTEAVFSMSGKPDSVACEQCGGEAQSIISRSAGSNSFVKDRPFEFDKSKCVQSFGKKFGRTDQQQHKVYQDYVEGMKKDRRAAKLSGKKNDIEWLGCMPGEMVDSIGQHVGDKEAVSKDPVTFLKKTDLYQGD